MSYDRTQAPRDYGGWRRRRGIGLFGLGATGTLAVLGALLVLIIVAAASPAALLYAGPPVLAAGGLGLARAGGEPLALAALRRMRWRYAGTRGYTRYRAGVVAQHSPAYQMPGVLAPLELLDCEDGYGGRYGIVLDKRSGLMTPTLRVVPASTWLADREDADGWVANWGGWLAVARLPADVPLGDGHRRHGSRSRAPRSPTWSPPRSIRLPRWPPGRSWPSSSRRRPPRQPTSTRACRSRSTPS